MTYMQLLDKLNQMPECRMQDTVTAFDPYEGEYIALIDFYPVDESQDQLASGHFVLQLKG